MWAAWQAKAKNKPTKPASFSYGGELTLDGKPLKRTGNKTGGYSNDKYIWRPGNLIRTGLTMVLSEQAKAPKDMATTVREAMLPFYQEPPARIQGIATFYKEDQLRGPNGRWIETGAEARTKAERRRMTMLDPNVLFYKYHDRDEAERLIREYGGEELRRLMPETQREAIYRWQGSAHRYINNNLRYGTVYDRPLTEVEVLAYYETSGMKAKDEAAARSQQHQSAAEYLANAETYFIRTVVMEREDAALVLPQGVQHTIDLLDAMWTYEPTKKYMRAPMNIKAYRGMYADMIPEPIVGDVYTDKGFIATSLFPKKAEAFGDRMNVIEIPEGTSALYLPTVSSSMTGEAEVLLPRDAQLVYMGEETYKAGGFLGEIKTARRWRYIGPKARREARAATFYQGDEERLVDETDEPELEPDKDGRFTWKPGDLHRTGEHIPIPPPRMPQDAPRWPEKPDNPPTGMRVRGGFSNPLE